MSFDMGIDTILLLIATIIQSDRMHISAKIVSIFLTIRCFYSRISNKKTYFYFFFIGSINICH